MPLFHRPMPALPGNPGPTRAFTFVEVLFAIMILGIGFIMIAAMLPVAIKQTEETQSDINGRAICESAFSLMSAHLRAGNALSPTTAEFQAPVSNFIPDRAAYTLGVATEEQNAAAARLASRIRGTTQLSTDRRFAWTFLLRRTAAEGAHEAVIIAMQSRNQNEYPSQLFDGVGGAGATEPRANNDNGPHVVTFTIVEGDNIGAGTVGPDLISFTAATSSGGTDITSALDTLVRDGTFVVSATGRVFRVGQRRTDLTGFVFELRPGINSDLPLIAFPNGTFAVDTSFNYPSFGYVVGAGLRDPTEPWNGLSNPFTGPTQDIAVMRVTLR